MLQLTYLALSFAGLTLTWHYNLQFIEETGGFALLPFIEACFINSASSSITVDLLVGASAFTIWMIGEAKRLNMRAAWLYILLSVFIAFAFAAPLFLLMRARTLALREA
ncbi:MAG: DUF2834 domain-containing protein [Myxococcota bacterium]|nr:DUF2834 domain-containing protein [Myxococcota bacterium]